MSGWIGVDLDGTLAFYDGDAWGIGAPIPKMLERVHKWLAEGREVRIFTARACVPAQIGIVSAWSKKHIGVELQVTNTKDFGMIELWDDRCVQVQSNTGELVADFWKHSL